MDKLKETDLAKSIIAWLQDQHWDIYQEVQFKNRGAVADIVAVRLGILWIIETKMHYSLNVLEQACSWQANLRSVGVFSSQTPRDYNLAIDYYHVGVLEVEPYGYVNEIKKAPLFIRKKEPMQQMINQLSPLHKTFAQAGSPGGYHLTPYKETMMEVKRIIQMNPGCSAKFLFEKLGECHYMNKNSFMGNILNALESFEPWCRIDKTNRPYKLFISDLIEN